MAKVIEHSSKVGDLFYRIDDRTYSVVIDAEREEYGSQLALVGSTYRVTKVTPKGVWLNVWVNKDRFVCLSHTKQFASPTKELAIQGFQARKKRQRAIYAARVNRADRAHDMAQTFDRFPHPPQTHF